MEKICDLHTHSYVSDGTSAPAELVRLAEAAGLSAVALCDHNTVAGLTEFLEAAAGSAVEAVPGVEFSTEYHGTELHILALFVRPEHYAAVTEEVEQMRRRMDESNTALLEALAGQGIALDYSAIKAGTPNGLVNRAVIGAEMVRQGICGSVKEALDKWLSKERGFYHAPRRLDSLETIRFIKSIGAAAVLAHPFLNMDEEGLRGFLTEAVPQGLDGMEVLYSEFTPEQTAAAKGLAAEFGLLQSGGSDFHGGNKPDIRMGTGRGGLHIPVSLLEGLRARASM